MSEQLYINNVQFDIEEGNLTRKIRIAEINDVGNRKSSFSYTMQLPETSRNIIALDMLGVSGNTSRTPFESLSVRYVENGNTLISNGFAIIRSSDDKFYEINIIDGILSLVQILGDKKLVDLPLSDLSHFLTTQNFTDSFAKESGYIYCLADFGLGVSSLVQIEKQAPSIFVHTLFRKIFESNGLALIGDFFTSNTDFLNEVLAPAKGYDILNLTPTVTPKGGADTDELSAFTPSSVPLTFEIKHTFTNNGLVGASIVDGNIVFSAPGTYNIVLDTDYDVDDTIMTLVARVNDIDIAVINIPIGNSTVENSLTITISASDVFSLYIKGGSTYDYAEDNQYFLDYDISTDLTLGLVTGGQLIEASDYIADIKQYDFIKDVINRYGLILKPIQDSENFEFKLIENVLDKTNFEDWTSKLALKSKENYNSSYAQNNNATYKYPSNIVNPTHDGNLTINNDNAENEKTLFASIFEIANEYDFYVNGNTIFTVPIWEGCKEGESEPFNDQEVASSYLKTDGTTAAFVGSNVMGFIVSDIANKDFRLNGHVEKVDGALVAYYDSGSVFISYEQIGSGTLAEFIQFELAVPANTVYILVNGLTADKAQLFELAKCTDDTVKNLETMPKIFSIDRQDLKILCRLFNEALGIEVTSDIPFLSLDNISLQYFLDTYYPNFQDLINDYKKVTFKMNLSAIDIYNIDFFKLKFLKHTGRFYYLNDITYRSGKQSDVIMMELP